jgi:hypothetical protein
MQQRSALSARRLAVVALAACAVVAAVLVLLFTAGLPGSPGRAASPVGVSTPDSPPVADEVPYVARVALVEVRGRLGVEIQPSELGAMLTSSFGDEWPDVLVLRVESEGGMLALVGPLSDMLHGLEARTGVVVWVRQALSATALAVLSAERIVFEPVGFMGGAVTVRVDPVTLRTEAIAGADLDRALEIGRLCALRGGRDPAIAVAMQTDSGLSCSEEGGEIRCFAGEGGTDVIAPPGDVLMLRANGAIRSGVSLGTAEELGGVVRAIGFDEYEHIGHGIAEEVSRRGAELGEVFSRLSAARARCLSVLDRADAYTSDDEREAAARTGLLALDQVREIAAQEPLLRAYAGIDESWLTTVRDELDVLRAPEAPG